jgi:riboflavin kinase/FMN adenylyltransferase
MVVSIGNFDGVHVGHQKLLNRLVERAKDNNCQSQVITFDPHPREVLTNSQVNLIQSVKERVEKMKTIGVDEVKVVQFDSELSQHKAEDFLDAYVGFENMVGMVQGTDFKFGHNGHCDIACLKEVGQQHDFFVEAIDPVIVDNQVVSSSLIRKLIKQDSSQKANKLL